MSKMTIKTIEGEQKEEESQKLMIQILCQLITLMNSFKPINSM